MQNSTGVRAGIGDIFGVSQRTTETYIVTTYPITFVQNVTLNELFWEEKFGIMTFDKIRNILYPLIIVLVYMRVYCTFNINTSSFLYKKEMLQQIFFAFNSTYFRMLEPIMILLVIKLLLEIILLFYKKIKLNNFKDIEKQIFRCFIYLFLLKI